MTEPQPHHHAQELTRLPLQYPQQIRGLILALGPNRPDAEPEEDRVATEAARHRRYAGLPIDVLVDHAKQLTFKTDALGAEERCPRITFGTVRLEKAPPDIALGLVKTDARRRLARQRSKGIYLTKR